MKIHVGNLSSETKQEDLQKAFETYGPVSGVNVIADKVTGEPRGFAFVEMSSSEDAAKAIAGMDNKELHGHSIRVQEARKPGGSR